MSSFTPASNTLWLPSGMPALARRSSACFHLDCQLARMIDVHAHPERMIFRQHRAQLRRDSLRQENRHPCADPQKFDVLDRAQPRKSFSSLSSLKIRASPPLKSTSRTSVCCFKITERLLEIRVQFLFANSANHSTPRAIAAVTRATVRHQKQDTIRIPMHQSRHRHVRIFAAGIGHVVRRRPSFLDSRNHLTPDRVIRIGSPAAG